MAFTTEFVMGAGGSVEEIPVSMSGGGGSVLASVPFPLTTVDTGDGALVILIGSIVPGNTNTNNRPHLAIGDYVDEQPHITLGDSRHVYARRYTGMVEVAILSRHSSITTFTGTVYVIRL